MSLYEWIIFWVCLFRYYHATISVLMLYDTWKIEATGRKRAENVAQIAESDLTPPKTPNIVILFLPGIFFAWEYINELMSYEFFKHIIVRP